MDVDGQQIYDVDDTIDPSMKHSVLTEHSAEKPMDPALIESDLIELGEQELKNVVG